ncbi:MAG: hypothetical protein LBK99_27585 [Opitutaceae bacterium]|jgi:hypothetical protein|nr:hypothetical protein [Opitutaceae bacterium]
MAFDIKRCGRLTYYYRKERPLFSFIITEDIGNGDLKVYLSGITGGESATRNCGLPDLVTMNPDEEIPRAFGVWEAWLREAQICDSLQKLDFIEMHVFGCQPRTPNPVTNPVAYGDELKRIRAAYARAYPAYFAKHLPGSGYPVRFTVHVVDVPDPNASYEFYSTALLQKSPV